MKEPPLASPVVLPLASPRFATLNGERLCHPCVPALPFGSVVALARVVPLDRHPVQQQNTRQDLPARFARGRGRSLRRFPADGRARCPPLQVLLAGQQRAVAPPAGCLLRPAGRGGLVGGGAGRTPAPSSTWSGRSCSTTASPRAATRARGCCCPRAGWIGQWKYGTSLWSGDIGSTLPILAQALKSVISAQVRQRLSVAQPGPGRGAVN